MTVLTKKEKKLAFKIYLINKKYPWISWNIRELAIQLNSSRSAICRLISKLISLGWLEEKIINYHNIFRRLTDQAMQKINAGVLKTGTKLGQFWDNLNPLKTDCNPTENQEVAKDKFPPPITPPLKQLTL